MQDAGTPVVRSTKHAMMKGAGLRIWHSCNLSSCSGGPKERVPRVSAADKHARLVCKIKNLSAEVESSVSRRNLTLSLGRKARQTLSMHI